MRDRSRGWLLGAALTLAAASLEACTDGTSGQDTGSPGGTAGTGPGGGGRAGSCAGCTAGQGSGANAWNLPVVGPSTDPCTNPDNPAGQAHDILWTQGVSNVGHDVREGQTIFFHWSDEPTPRNVLQVADWGPKSTFVDAGWPLGIKTPKSTTGSFTWNAGSYPCGYRPGLYYFVDQDDPGFGTLSASITYDENRYFDSQNPPDCSVLASPDHYGGRYASYATRPGCKVYEINAFQTTAHYDWVPPVFARSALQGDLVVFRWTNEHNVVQVHDVTQDLLYPGGVTSGAKSNCAGGPHYSCANGSPLLGEWLFDTANVRPGIIHFSDEGAMTYTGHSTGMDAEVALRMSPDARQPVAGSCCAIDRTKGASCRVIEIINDFEGAQFDYNVGVGRGDLVRFRFAGKMRVYQSQPDADGWATMTPKPGGLAMPAAVECTPGPNMTCLEGTTDAAQLVLDVDQAIKQGLDDTHPGGQPFFTFAGGEAHNIVGYTSSDTRTNLYVDPSIPFDTTPCP